MEKNSSRVYGLDLLRGAAIILMVIYHGLFSLVYLFGVDLAWFRDPIFNNVGAPLIGGTFTLISGISSRYSRSSLKRGLKVLVWGLVMTLVTAIAVPDLIIQFGILHLMGCCMILTALLRPLLDKLPRSVGAGLAALLFALTYNLPNGGWLGIKGLLAVQIQTANPYLFPFGLLAPGFYSSDYYPLIPWFFLFVCGYYLGAWVKEGKAPKWLYPSRLPSLEFVGRHTLWVYVLHQPILVAVFWLIFRLI